MPSGGKRPGSGRPSEKTQTKVRGKQEPPVKPADMEGVYANQIWDQAVEALPHILRPVDYGILRMACEAFELAMTSEDEKVRLSAMRAYESCANKIGMTPHSRRIVKPVDNEEPEQISPLDDWLQRGALN